MNNLSSGDRYVSLHDHRHVYVLLNAIGKYGTVGWLLSSLDNLGIRDSTLLSTSKMSRELYANFERVEDCQPLISSNIILRLIDNSPSPSHPYGTLFHRRGQVFFVSSATSNIAEDRWRSILVPLDTDLRYTHCRIFPDTCILSHYIYIGYCRGRNYISEETFLRMNGPM